MRSPTRRHHFIFLVLVAISLGLTSGPRCFGQSNQGSEVLVKVYTKARDAKVGVFLEEDANQITILDLESGKNVTVEKTANTKIEKPLSLDDAARTTGLTTVVAWKLGKMAARDKPSGKIARLTNQVLYVTLGKQHGVKNGQKLKVFRNDGEIVDPDTGEVLGAERSLIGELEVLEANEKFSKTKYTGEFEVMFRVGDEVEPDKHKTVIAVCPIYDEDGTLTNVGAAVSEDLTTRLVQKHVTVVERSVIGSAIGELFVQNTLFFDKESAQKIGKLTGANFVLAGKIVPKRNLGDIYLRLVDVQTGEIVFAISDTVSLAAAEKIRNPHNVGGGATPPPKASRDAVLERLRDKIGGTIWQSGGARISLERNGSTGIYMNGGRWEKKSRNSIKIYDNRGNYRVTLDFAKDYRSANASWVGGKKQIAKRRK